MPRDRDKWTGQEQQPDVHRETRGVERARTGAPGRGEDAGDTQRSECRDRAHCRNAVCSIAIIGYARCR